MSSEFLSLLVELFLPFLFSQVRRFAVRIISLIFKFFRVFCQLICFDCQPPEFGEVLLKLCLAFNVFDFFHQCLADVAKLLLCLLQLL